MYWVNFTKSGNSYFGTATLPKLTEGSHNATILVRAEQDQVTTYIPFWSAFSKTITLTNQVSTPPTPTVPEFSLMILLPLFLSTLFSAVLIRKTKASWIQTISLNTIKVTVKVLPNKCRLEL